MTEAIRRRRPRGSGGVFYAEGPGLWVAEVEAGYSNGKRHRRRVSSKSREVVEAKLAALLCLPEEMRQRRPQQTDDLRGRDERMAAADARATHSVEAWFAKRDAVNCCVYCGSPGPLVMDHATPISRGGSNGIDNVVPACDPCNTTKMHRTAAEFVLDRALGIA